MANKRKRLHQKVTKKSSTAPLRRKRDVALQPSPRPAPLRPNPPAPENERPVRLRALTLRDRPSPSAAVEQQQISKTKQTGKQGRKRKELFPRPATPLQTSSFDDPPTPDTRLRSLPRQIDGPPPQTYRTKRNAPKKQILVVENEQEVAPRPKQLPRGTICISTLLSAEDLKKNQELAMPVALRRPSTSHSRRLSEKENARPNGTLSNGLPNGLSHRQGNAAAHARNQTLTNSSLPGSTHSHPSQAPAPPPAPSRTEEKDREKALERNIDNVVFGDRMFRAWYPSWYPKEIIGEKALSDAKAVGIVVQTLYVCKKCFGYGKEVHDWARHCQRCEKELPGTRVYLHGAGEGKSEKECVWSVWEVDGGVDTVSPNPLHYPHFN
jgi:hypothetical protein